jgi:hypothetical protein
MSDELRNFQAWYVDVLRLLYPIRNAGIAVFMLSLPLLERYLRQKNRRSPADPLDEACMRDLCAMFPALPDATVARQFWNVYRNGFLHQVTPSQTKAGSPLPVGWLTHDIDSAIRVESDGSFCVQPVLFSQRVVSVIESNFAVFSGIAAGAPALPVVCYRDPVTIPSAYLGTRAGPP